MSPKTQVLKFMYSLLSPQTHQVREVDRSPSPSCTKRMSST